MNFVIDVLKKNAGKSISLGTLLILVMMAQALIQYGDTRWCLADEVEQTQQVINQHIERGLEDSIMVINMKQAGATQDQIDAALKSKYEARLKALRDRNQD